MSTIKVEVTQIRSIRPHPNADKLELATVNGWQTVVPIGKYGDGDKVVYFEPGIVLPEETATQMGVVNYLSNKTDIDGKKVLVVHRIKLRGEPSFGLVMPAGTEEIGQDVAHLYGATKYHPPVKTQVGDADVDHPLSPKYTDIENMRSYPDVLGGDESIVVTEKLHGTSCRVGAIIEDGEEIWVAGSRQLRRKDPGENSRELSLYWKPLTISGVQALIRHYLDLGAKQVVLYGEVYGRGIQSYHYDRPVPEFAAFDLLVDGKYVDFIVFQGMTRQFCVPTVPFLHLGQFDLEAIKLASNGESLVGGNHGREGVVVKPVQERQDAKIGRVILKYVGDDYLFGKSAEQDTTDL